MRNCTLMQSSAVQILVHAFLCTVNWN